MGLIVETIPLHMGSVIAPIRIVHAITKVCTDGSSSSTYTDNTSFDTTIYNILSKRSDMKVLTTPNRVRSEFDLYLQYAESKTSGGVNTDFDTLDTYLGNIGVTHGIC